MRLARRVFHRLLPMVETVATVFVPWRRLYAWTLDYQERKNRISNILKVDETGVMRGGQGLYDVSRGAYHAAFMERHGLRPAHRFLDFGCGYGRTTIPLLRFLEPSRYTGVEIAKERLRLAREYVAQEELEERDPTFVLSDDLTLSYLADRSIDFFWAQSVFTHMPYADAGIVIDALARVLDDGGRAVFDFGVLEDDSAGRADFKDFFYSLQEMRSMAASLGFSLTVLEDWGDDLPSERRHAHIRMVKLERTVV